MADPMRPVRSAGAQPASIATMSMAGKIVMYAGLLPIMGTRAYLMRMASAMATIAVVYRHSGRFNCKSDKYTSSPHWMYYYLSSQVDAGMSWVLA